MNLKNPLYSALGIDTSKRQNIKNLARELGTTTKVLDYHDANNILPNNALLDTIEKNLNIRKEELMIRMGIYDTRLKKLFSKYGAEIIQRLDKEEDTILNHNEVFKTDQGNLYQGDCLSLLKSTEDDVFDMVFADPPFNLKKIYRSNMDDNLSTLEYIEWTEKWLDECIRTLKPGGSLFLWNIPKWNSYFSEYLNQRLNFKHWIATDIKLSLPISGRLYPSHYSLLYYIKGEKANTFSPDRLAMSTCPKCYGDLKDYGGYKNKMNPKGISLTDIWFDIPPVRHSKYKGRKDANELSIKLLDRIIEMSTKEGDYIFDPFGGSGTSYIVAELKNRRWKGIELGPTDDIVTRFENLESESVNVTNYRSNYNNLFPDKIKAKRIKNNLWTAESVRENS